MLPIPHYHLPVPALPTLPSYPSSSLHPHTHLGHFHPALPHTHPTASTTYIPSLIPPGMDAAHVDMRAFCPYTPNERKHRNRTTRPQLRVLEDVYTRETKPNASLRRALAAELGMTPRGVQVWFQNRRAKMKNLAKKALVTQQTQGAQETGSGEHADGSGSGGAISPPEEDDDEVQEVEGPFTSQESFSPPSSEDATPRAAERNSASPVDTPDITGQSSSTDHHGSALQIPGPDMRSESAPVQKSTPIVPPPVPRFPSQPEVQTRIRLPDSLDVPEAYLLAQRRPSLPTYAHAHAAALQLQQEHLQHPHSTPMEFSHPSYGDQASLSPSHPAPPSIASSHMYAQQPHSSQGDALYQRMPLAPAMLSRRRSAIDPHTQAHVNRLSSHPYAPMVAQRNTDLYARPVRYTRHYSLGGVPGMAAHAAAGYAVTRDVLAPPPGPLPAPDFSFGAPPSESVDLPQGIERSISQPLMLHSGMSAPEFYSVKAEDQFGDQDAYRDGIAYHQPPGFRVPDAQRFGSLGGESDVSSSGPLFSDASSGEDMLSISRRGSLASAGFDRRASGDDGRRGSFVSTHMAELLSGLDVNTAHSNPSSQAPSRRPSYAHLPQLPENAEAFTNSLEAVPPLRRQRSSLAYGMHTSPSKLSNAFSFESEPTNHFSSDSIPPSDLQGCFAGFSFQQTAPVQAAEYSPYDIPPSAEVGTSIAAPQPGYAAVAPDAPIPSSSMEHTYPAPSYPPNDVSSLYTYQLGMPPNQDLIVEQQQQSFHQEQNVPQLYQNHHDDQQLGNDFGAQMVEGAMNMQHMHIPDDAMRAMGGYMMQ